MPQDIGALQVYVVACAGEAHCRCPRVPSEHGLGLRWGDDAGLAQDSQHGTRDPLPLVPEGATGVLGQRMDHDIPVEAGPPAAAVLLQPSGPALADCTAAEEFDGGLA